MMFTDFVGVSAVLEARLSVPMSIPNIRLFLLQPWA